MLTYVDIFDNIWALRNSKWEILEGTVHQPISRDNIDYLVKAGFMIKFKYKQINLK